MTHVSFRLPQGPPGRSTGPFLEGTPPQMDPIRGWTPRRGIELGNSVRGYACLEALDTNPGRGGTTTAEEGRGRQGGRDCGGGRGRREAG